MEQTGSPQVAGVEWWGLGKVGGDPVFKLVPHKVDVYLHVENKGGITLHEGVSGLEQCR